MRINVESMGKYYYIVLILQKLQTKIVKDEQLLKILNGNCDELYVVLETI